MAIPDVSRQTLESHGAFRDLVALISRGIVAVLSGAGLSTESGIPDYRGPDGLRRVRPMTIAEFRASPANRQRYWARSHVGWPRFSSAQPNDGHRCVASLAALGLVNGVITQNVDGLHQRAGSSGVIELHGSLSRVICMHCGQGIARADLDAELALLNPTLRTHAVGLVQPDGDVALPDEVVEAFHPPVCSACGSDMVKPDVVFFGDAVPPAVVAECNDLVDSADALLVLGSSLQVMSGLRFVRRAVATGRPVAIVTNGPTRGDDLARVRLQAPLGATLRAILTNIST
ncbi:MAG TPA: Sir2 family NAD-dependent protein deacetylase [Dermatophilaceae bacterium]|nr:Sir2 family NAD-dependent protein deacetylase [Dermatophilaceae bacterium]